MRKIIKLIKKYVGEVSLIAGSYITTNGVFSFDYSRGCGGSRVPIPTRSTYFSEACSNPIAYYYSGSDVENISIGVSLILIGILFIKNKIK